MLAAIMRSTPYVAVFVTLITTSACSSVASVDVSGAEADIRTVLDAWHAAAARADEEAYFRHFAPDAVFLGTDATERWTLPEFRAYAHPIFARGKAWNFRAARRAISVAPSGELAWFDEDLVTEGLGPARGSGVLVRSVGNGRWQISQYNLAITIPNDRFTEVKELLENPRLVRGPEGWCALTIDIQTRAGLMTDRAYRAHPTIENNRQKVTETLRRRLELAAAAPESLVPAVRAEAAYYERLAAWADSHAWALGPAAPQPGAQEAAGMEELTRFGYEHCGIRRELVE